jgi:hypothetical protein
VKKGKGVGHVPTFAHPLPCALDTGSGIVKSLLPNHRRLLNISSDQNRDHTDLQLNLDKTTRNKNILEMKTKDGIDSL